MRWRAPSTIAASPVHAAHRKELFLRRDPLGHVQLGEYLALHDRIEHRAHVQLLDIAIRARRHDGDAALVPGHAADRVDARREAAAHDLGGAQAEVLLRARADAHACLRARAFIRIDRHELHVHEWRLARLVEPRARHHRVVPVERLALAAGGGRRRGHPRLARGAGRSGGGRRHGHAALHAEAIGGVHAGPERGGADQRTEEVFRFHGLSLCGVVIGSWPTGIR
jgi:hypothetical protein